MNGVRSIFPDSFMRRFWLLPLAVALVFSASAEAGPWVAQPGGGYLQGGVSYFSAQEGQREGVATGLSYQTTTFSLYGEVGLPGRLQLTTYLPYVLAVNESGSSDVRYNHNSIGDVMVALDQAPLRNFPLTFGVEVKFPGYSDPTQADGAAGIDNDLFDSSKFPVLGDNNIDVTPRVQIGKSLGDIPVWMQMSVGYRFRSCQLHGGGRCRDFRDGLAADASIGGWVWNRNLAVQIFVKGNLAIERDTINTTPTEESLYVQGKLTFADEALAGVSTSIGVGVIPYANNAARGYDISLSLAYQF